MIYMFFRYLRISHFTKIIITKKQIQNSPKYSKPKKEFNPKMYDCYCVPGTKCTNKFID